MSSAQRAPRVLAPVTLFGFGYFPFSASGASLVALAVYYAFAKTLPAAFAFTFFVVSLIVTAISAHRNSSFVVSDPKQAVSDEFIGMFILLLVAGTASPFALLIAFVTFRILDIVKPFPFNWLDRNVHGIYGFLIDDLAIGVVVGVALRLAAISFHLN